VKKEKMGEADGKCCSDNLLGGGGVGTWKGYTEKKVKQTVVQECGKELSNKG